MKIIEPITQPPGMEADPAHPAPSALVHPCTAEVPEMQEQLSGRLP